MRRALALSLCLVAAPAFAQEDDRGYLTAFLEDNLSGAGRQVTITGFEGALSARATIQKLQIADDAGVWITLDNVVLDWSRSALFSGEVVINELSASQITLDRLPTTSPDAATPEATPFALPELPVSIDIGKISADRIVLGAPVLGTPVEASLTAALTLSGGEGQANLQLLRTDAEGQVALTASYANETGRLDLDLDAREGAGGIAATKLGLPGAPQAALTVKGGGTLTDFAADVRLETDGEARLAGPVTLAVDDKGARVFTAQLQGNPAPLFLPQYAGFLGNALALDVAGRSFPEGSLRIDRLALTSERLNLSGTLGVAVDGLPSDFDLTARIASPDGGPVLLPLSGTETRVTLADIALKFDAAQDEGWTGQAVIEGLDRADFRASRAELAGSGRIGRITGQKSLGATLTFVAEGLSPTDAALATALGSIVTGRAVLNWREGVDGLNLPQLVLTGDGYGLNAGVRIEGIEAQMRTTGRVELVAEDLSRFSMLAGQQLGGTATLRANGEVSLLSGAFDLDLAVEGERLVTGIAQADSLLSGPSTILASVLRDETGLTLESLSARAASLRFSGQGKLTSDNSTLEGTLDWANLSDLGGGLGGALRATTRFAGNATDATLSLEGQGSNLRIGQPEVNRLIAGTADLSFAGALEGGTPKLVSLKLAAPNLSADVSDAGGGTLNVAGRLANLALLAPEFPGPVTVSGRVTPDGAAVVTDIRVNGPGGIDARIAGRIDGAAPDITIAGTAQAGLANAFTGAVNIAGAVGYDLALRGGWGLPSLSGRVTLSGGSVAVPARGLSLNRVAVSADLSGGSARLTATAEPQGGGQLRVDGTLGLTAPYQASLDLVVARLGLKDPELYETTLNATLRLAGPLLGAAQLSGRVEVGETELRIPATGFSSAADLEAVTHVGDSPAVRATRQRAGVGQGEGSSAGGSGLPPWGLDITVNAPARIFLRGRGLDAELGGSVRLLGTLANIVPSGGLELIRGRLDLLGKRLTLTDATARLEGSLVPFIRVSASADSEGVTSFVVIEGPADAPEVNFTSTPELPQEEVLAHLLFGKGLQSISAFQAAQLANAVAVLAGRGGEGIVGRLRKGFGFDDLDISTDESGSTAVKAGKYLSENVYTEFSLGQDGNTRINLNLDIRKGLTAKGRVDSDGESGIGIFLEKDY